LNWQNFRMITIIIEAWPLLSELFGGDKTHRYVFKMEVAENTTLKDLIATLCERNPGLGQFFIKTEKKELCGTSMFDSPFEVIAIGDCIKPRRIVNTIWEGFHILRLI